MKKSSGYCAVSSISFSVGPLELLIFYLLSRASLFCLIVGSVMACWNNYLRNLERSGLLGFFPQGKGGGSSAGLFMLRSMHTG